MPNQVNDSEDDWAGKIETARASFKEVLASDEHEDGKAQRILTAMAFLTAAAGFIFGHVKSVDLNFPVINNIGFAPFSFFMFVATMIAGTLFLLAALGPRFNIPTPWRNRNAGGYPRSLLFSQLIIEESQEKWTSHWTNSTPEKLNSELASNYAFEAYLLSQKVGFKVGSMKVGKVFYKVALGFLGLLMIPVFTTDERLVYSVSAWLICGVVLQELLERLTSPPAWQFNQWTKLKSRVFWNRDVLSLDLVIGLVLLAGFVSLFVIGFVNYF